MSRKQIFCRYSDLVSFNTVIKLQVLIILMLTMSVGVHSPEGETSPTVIKSLKTKSLCKTKTTMLMSEPTSRRHAPKPPWLSVESNSSALGDPQPASLTSFKAPLPWSDLYTTLPNYSSRKRRNKRAHMTNGNRSQARGKPLITMFWNKGNSHLFRKMQDIQTLVSSHKPHIFGLAEANVLNNHDQTEIQIPNYTLHLASSLSGPEVGGLGVSRVAVYTHSSITVRRRNDLEDGNLQLVCLEAGLPRMKKSIYMVGYRQWQLPGDRASSSVTAQGERWSRILTNWETALSEGKEVITVMDANLDAITWRNELHKIPRHSTSITHSTLIDDLHDRILPSGVEMMTPLQPTWARGDQRSCLDHVYTTAPGKLSPVSIIWTGMSDHALLKFNRYTKTVQNRVAYVRKRTFKNFKAEDFKRDVVAMPELGLILQCRDVEWAASLLTNGLTKILDVMAPIRTIQTRKDYAPHMTDETKVLQDHRNLAQKRAVVSGDQRDWREYRSLRNQTTASLRRDLVAYRRQKLCSQENSPAEVWSTVKRILNWEKGGPPSQLFHGGRILNKPAAVAGAINSFFIKKIRNIMNNIPHVDSDPLTKLKERMKSRQCTLTFQSITEDEVLKVIKSIKPTTATGVDFIDNQTLKLVACEITPALTHIINLSISTSTFPTIYKWSKVTPLLKKSSLDPILPSSYRPVNQLVSISKIIERCVFGQLVKYLEANSLLHPNQHGGRGGHSTTTTLIQMHNQWMEDLEDGKTVAVTLVDQSAAFDVCNHKIILDKLRLLGLDSVEWVASYLTGRTQSVAIGAALSAPLNLPDASVVQGGVGSGILYNVMTCDLPDVIHTDHEVSLEDNDHHCQEDGDMVTFVDDATFYFGHEDTAEVTRVINKNFAAIELYMNANKLKVNNDKTHLLVVTKSGGGEGRNRAAYERRAEVTLTAGGEVIEQSDSELLLGATIHHTGTWAAMIRDGKASLQGQLRNRVNALKKICQQADFITRKTVAGGLIQSKLQYLLPLFGAAPEYLLRSLQVQQMAAARAVVGPQSFRWSNIRILNYLGWLNVKQQYVASTLTLAHKIVTTGKPTNLHRSMVTPYPYNTRRVAKQELRACAGTVRGRDRTALTIRTFQYQAISYYNSIPIAFRSYTQNRFKSAAKAWAKTNVT